MPWRAPALPSRGRSGWWPRQCLGALWLCHCGANHGGGLGDASGRSGFAFAGQAGNKRRNNQPEVGLICGRGISEDIRTSPPSGRVGIHWVQGGVTYLSSFFRLEMADAGRGKGVFRGVQHGAGRYFPPGGEFLSHHVSVCRLVLVSSLGDLDFQNCRVIN